MNNKWKRYFSVLDQIVPMVLILLLALPSLADETQSSQIQNGKMTDQACQAYLVNTDIEQKYEKLKKTLEVDFNSGLPNKLKMQLVELRNQTDFVSEKIFEIEKNNGQEINSLVKETVDRLETFMQILPQVANNAPKVRNSYIVPFTNISSLRSEQQNCLMKAAIEQVKDQKPVDQSESSFNIYSKLTEEMNHLNANLYLAETTDVQKFIGLRAELLFAIEKYNETQNPEMMSKVIQKIPETVNAVQIEIEKLIPSLELSEKYYSILSN